MNCDLRNHFDCAHRDEDHVRPNLLNYLDGWSTVAAVIEAADREHDGTILSATVLDPTIEYFESNGVRDAYDEGVRDAILVAFGQ